MKEIKIDIRANFKGTACQKQNLKIIQNNWDEK